MGSMLEIIKKAGLGAVDAGNPVAVMFGKVESSSPLSVTVDERFTLTEDFLLLPESLTARRVTVAGQEVVLRDGLRQGDQVLLLRMQGGRQFVLLDRVVSP